MHICSCKSATVTFVRFFPTMKVRYDYGLLIFILTFSLVSVSDYQEDKVLHMAHQRVTTIIMASLSLLLHASVYVPFGLERNFKI